MRCSHSLQQASRTDNKIGASFHRAALSGWAGGRRFAQPVEDAAFTAGTGGRDNFDSGFNRVGGRGRKIETRGNRLPGRLPGGEVELCGAAAGENSLPAGDGVAGIVGEAERHCQAGLAGAEDGAAHGEPGDLARIEAERARDERLRRGGAGKPESRER